jgi:hypothetical protein
MSDAGIDEHEVTGIADRHRDCVASFLAGGFVRRRLRTEHAAGQDDLPRAERQELDSANPPGSDSGCCSGDPPIKSVITGTAAHGLLQRNCRLRSPGPSRSTTPAIGNRIR